MALASLLVRAKSLGIGAVQALRRGEFSWRVLTYGRDKKVEGQDASDMGCLFMTLLANGQVLAKGAT